MEKKDSRFSTIWFRVASWTVWRTIIPALSNSGFFGYSVHVLVTRLLGISDLVVNNTRVLWEHIFILRLIKYYRMKTCGDLSYCWALDEGGWSASLPARFEPDEISYSTH